MPSEETCNVTRYITVHLIYSYTTLFKLQYTGEIRVCTTFALHRTMHTCILAVVI